MKLMRNLGIYLLFTAIFAPQAQAMNFFPKVRYIATILMKQNFRAPFTTQTCTRLAAMSPKIGAIPPQTNYLRVPAQPTFGQRAYGLMGNANAQHKYEKFIDSSDVPAAESNKTLKNSSSDLILVPFDFVTHGPQAQKIFQESFGTLPAILRGQPDTQNAQVLSYQGTVVGVIVYKDYRINNTIQREIHNLCIDSAYRNKNYGSYIMHEFEQLTYLQGVSVITLSPVPRAVPFYRRLGYHFIATDEDMVKTLKPLNQNTPPLA